MKRELCSISCDDLVPSLSPIDDPYEVENILRRVSQMSHTAKGRFPGENPVSFHSLEKKTSDYLVTLKTDGIRYMLVLLQRYEDGSPLAVMFDRKMKMYEVEVWAEESFFREGLLMDGELTIDEENGVFLVFDILFERRWIGDQPFFYRMETYRSLIFHGDTSSDFLETEILNQEKIVFYQNYNNLKMIPKQFLDSSHVVSLWERRRFSPYKNDGVIFIEKDSFHTVGTSKNVLKWKIEHTLDVKLILEDGQDWKQMRKETFECLPVIVGYDGMWFDISKEDVLKQEDIHDMKCNLLWNDLVPFLKERNLILECSCTIEEGVMFLNPLKERSDKSSPNSFMCFKSTLSDISSQPCLDILMGRS